MRNCKTVRVFSDVCVSFWSVFVTMYVCACVCVWHRPSFYSHIYIHSPSLYSTLLPKHRPQLSLFPVHPQRSYSWQKTHQVGRTTDNWGDDRSCSKTIDSDGDRGSGALSRLTELSGGSGSARPECGITHRIDAAALVEKNKTKQKNKTKRSCKSNISIYYFLKFQINQKYAAVHWFIHLLYSQKKKKGIGFFLWQQQYSMCWPRDHPRFY